MGVVVVGSCADALARRREASQTIICDIKIRI
jgi:hypothetical protein